VRHGHEGPVKVWQRLGITGWALDLQRPRACVLGAEKRSMGALIKYGLCFGEVRP
jgi:hypothetical protein